MKPKKLRKLLYKRLKTFVKQIIKFSPEDELEQELNDLIITVTQLGAKIPAGEEGASVQKVAYKQLKVLFKELATMTPDDQLTDLEKSIKEMFLDLGVDENGRLILEKQDLSVLKLYPYTVEILEDNEIYSVGELLEYSEKDLLAFKGLGPKAVMRIDEALKKVGLTGLRVEEAQKKSEKII